MVTRTTEYDIEGTALGVRLTADSGPFSLRDTWSIEEAEFFKRELEEAITEAKRKGGK